MRPFAPNHLPCQASLCTEALGPKAHTLAILCEVYMLSSSKSVAVPSIKRQILASEEARSLLSRKVSISPGAEKD